MNRERIKPLNERIGRDVGRTPDGRPLFQWLWSEDLTHMRRVPGYDYKANVAGILVAEPKYEKAKLNPLLNHQWVLCKWESPIPEAEWRAQHGESMLWPRHGMYYPTNVTLDRGFEPDNTFTEMFIIAWKAQRQKTLADHAADTERGLDMQERADDSRLDSMIRNDMTAFGNAPGKKLHVSLPSVASSKTAEVSQQGS